MISKFIMKNKQSYDFYSEIDNFEHENHTFVQHLFDEKPNNNYEEYELLENELKELNDLLFMTNEMLNSQEKTLFNTEKIIENVTKYSKNANNKIKSIKKSNYIPSTSLFIFIPLTIMFAFLKL